MAFFAYVLIERVNNINFQPINGRTKMAVDIFLGEPPAHIKQWIIEHATPPGPVPHADTRFTLEDGTVETYNITGTINRSWMVTNGYWSEDKGQWLKTITQADIGNTVTSIGE